MTQFSVLESEPPCELLSAVVTLAPAASAQAPAWLARAAHAWLLARIARSDPALADALHEADTPRPFTVSNLWGTGRARDGLVTLTPDRPCWLRFTALNGPLVRALQAALPQPGERLNLADAPLVVQSVASDEGEHPWAGRATYAGLLEQHTLRPDPAPRYVTLRFASPTTFRSQGRDLPLPLPSLVFDGLLRKWNLFAPLALPEEAKRYAEECVTLSRFRLRSHWVTFESGDKGAQVGFTGEVRFRFLTGDAYWNRVMTGLAAYAFWAGTGYRTTAGLGQTQAVR
jgi:CRISPR-associated endoribonuclease Cas6